MRHIFLLVFLVALTEGGKLHRLKHKSGGLERCRSAKGNVVTSPALCDRMSNCVWDSREGQCSKSKTVDAEEEPESPVVVSSIKSDSVDSEEKDIVIPDERTVKPFGEEKIAYADIDDFTIADAGGDAFVDQADGDGDDAVFMQRFASDDSTEQKTEDDAELLFRTAKAGFQVHVEVADKDYFLVTWDGDHGCGADNFKHMEIDAPPTPKQYISSSEGAHHAFFPRASFSKFDRPTFEVWSVCEDKKVGVKAFTTLDIGSKLVARRYSYRSVQLEWENGFYGCASAANKKWKISYYKYFVKTTAQGSEVQTLEANENDRVSFVITDLDNAEWVFKVEKKCDDGSFSSEGLELSEPLLFTELRLTEMEPIMEQIKKDIVALPQQSDWAPGCSELKKWDGKGWKEWGKTSPNIKFGQMAFIINSRFQIEKLVQDNELLRTLVSILDGFDAWDDWQDHRAQGRHVKVQEDRDKEMGYWINILYDLFQARTTDEMQHVLENYQTLLEIEGNVEKEIKPSTGLATGIALAGAVTGPLTGGMSGVLSTGLGALAKTYSARSAKKKQERRTRFRSAREGFLDSLLSTMGLIGDDYKNLKDIAFVNLFSKMRTCYTKKQEIGESKMKKSLQTEFCTFEVDDFRRRLLLVIFMDLTGIKPETDDDEAAKTNDTNQKVENFLTFYGAYKGWNKSIGECIPGSKEASSSNFWETMVAVTKATGDAIFKNTRGRTGTNLLGPAVFGAPV